MASDDAMDVETAAQALYMDVEQQIPPTPGASVQSESTPSSNPTHVEDSQQTSDDASISPEVADIILMARRVLVAFMRERRTEDIVPDNSRVVIVDGNVRLRQAFRALLENGTSL